MNVFVKLYFFIFILLSGCYYNSVYLKGTKKIRVLCKAEVGLSNSHILKETTKYLNYKSQEDYKHAFLRGLYEDLKDHNLYLVSDTFTIVDYTLVISQIDLIEKNRLYSVNDQRSYDNGKTYLLSICKAKAEAFLYKGEHDKLIDKISIYIDKEEKATNQQNFFESIFGVNKDGKNYYHRELSVNVFEFLSQKAGSKVSARVTRLARKNK